MSAEEKPVEPPQGTPNSEPKSEPTPADKVKGFTVDLSQGFEKALAEVKERASRLFKKGQFTKVRLKFRGKELATVPMSVLVAAEAATFLGGGGLIRFLVVNALGRTFLEVELINEADTVVQAGRERLLDGELDDALERFREAIAMDDSHAPAHLNLGVALKLKGARDEAQAAFEKAAQLDPSGDTGREAKRQLEQLKPRA